MKARSLAGAVAFYLATRRALGFALRSDGAQLESLVRFARQRGHRGPLTTSLALAWAEVPPPSASLRRARRLETVRRFALFWVAFDSRTQVPPAGLYGPAYRRVPVHPFTPQQIRALLEAARKLPPRGGWWAQSFGTLLGLLACTGLRISEALNLQLRDWEPSEAVLTIRKAKFGQSRLVPLAPSAAAALQAYLRARAKTFPHTRSAALFLGERAQAITYPRAQRTFAALRRLLGWDRGRPRPRLHDLRHAFALNCLLGWYRQGEAELNAKILSLAVYLGHRNIRYTYWYLSADPELLALGCARRARGSSGAKGGTHE